MTVISFQRRFCIYMSSVRIKPGARYGFVVAAFRRTSGRRLGRDDRLLTLISADCGLRDFDAHLVGDLQLDGLLAQPRHLAVNAAGRDDAVADLQTAEKLLDFGLLPFHRQQDHEIKNGENERERNEGEPGTAAIGRRRQREQRFEVPERVDHHSESAGWREKLWWNASLKLSNRPISTLSLILRMVSR